MRSPWRFSNASIIDCGAAEPPTTMRRTDDVSYLPGFASSSWRIPIQIVGTPAVIVTCSCWNASSRLSPSRNGPGEHLLGADERAGEREAPCVRVEHRHDRQHGVVLRDREHAGHRGRERVDGDRAVRVEGAFRLPGRPARVAHGGCGSLVDLPVREVSGLGAREQILVLDRSVRRRAVADRDHVLEAGALAEVLDERPEHLVRDQDAIARVRRDVGQVVGVQAEVQRVRDHPAHGDADVGLEVLVVVPGEGADAVAVLQAELVAQGGRETARARRELGIGVAMPALVGKARDDLPVAEELLAAPQDRGHVELVIHDQAVHLSLLG